MVEEVEKAGARAKSNANLKQNKGADTDMQNFASREGLVRDKLGALAGVSGFTYEKGATVFKEGPQHDAGLED